MFHCKHYIPLQSLYVYIYCSLTHPTIKGKLLDNHCSCTDSVDKGGHFVVSTGVATEDIYIYIYIYIDHTKTMSSFGNKI